MTRRTIPSAAACVAVAMVLALAQPARAQIVSKSCQSCGRPVSPSAKVGDRCPYCGVIWTTVNWTTVPVDIVPPVRPRGTWGPPLTPIPPITPVTRGERRVDFNLKEDERRAREERGRLVRQRGEFVEFLNGFSEPLSHAAFRRARMSLEQTPEMAQLLQRPVPPMPAGDFDLCDILWRGLVSGDGTLVAPPWPLGDPKRDGKLAEARRRFEDCWDDLAADLVVGRPATPDQLAALNSSLAGWRETFDAAARDWSPLYAARCRTHLNAIGRLATGLKHGQNVDRLRVYLQAPIAGFPGGTAAELIQFIDRYRLPLAYGSRPQLVLSELGHDMLRQLDHRIADLDSSVERFKAQTMALPGGRPASTVVRWPTSSPGPASGDAPYSTPTTYADRLGFIGPLQDRPTN